MYCKFQKNRVSLALFSILTGQDHISLVLAIHHFLPLLVSLFWIWTFLTDLAWGIHTFHFSPLSNFNSNSLNGLIGASLISPGHCPLIPKMSVEHGSDRIQNAPVLDVFTKYTFLYSHQQCVLLRPCIVLKFKFYLDISLRLSSKNILGAFFKSLYEVSLPPNHTALLQ